MLKRGLLSLALAAAVIIVSGCAAGTGPAETGWTAVPITDVKTVAGKWAGTLTRAQGSRDDWLTLTIRDDGSYEAVSDRTIGEFRSTGKFALSDGKLASRGEEGSMVIGLATRGAQRRLDLSVTNREGAVTGSTLAPAR